MSIHDEAEKLIEKHSAHQTSVMFLPSNMFGSDAEPQWIGQKTRSSLLEAVELIVAERDNYAGFAVYIHIGDEDKTLEQETINQLVAYVVESKRND